MARPIRSSPSMAVPPAWLERELDRALEDSSSVIVNRGGDLTESGRNHVAEILSLSGYGAPMLFLRHIEFNRVCPEISRTVSCGGSRSVAITRAPRSASAKA